MKILRQLRWKLTLSYTIVTVCAFLAVILIVAGVILPRIFVPENIITPEGIIDLLREDTLPLWSHMLSQPEVDTKLMRLLLEGSNATINNKEVFRIGSLRFSIGTTAAIRFFVIGPEGELLGKTERIDHPQFIIGQPFDPGFYEGLEAPFKAALLGETNSTLLYTVNENGRYLIALPVFGDERYKLNQVVGVGVVVIESIPNQTDIPAHMLGIAGRSLAILLFGFGIMGAIFGTFFANGLSRRFNQLFTAIDAWSLGDFSKFIVDNAGDEISQFAERLNGMANQLQVLLRRRHDMAVSEERSRLARDLHDSAKQQALAASFELGTALTLFDSDPGKARQHMVEADALVDSVRKELTNLVDELRPHPIDGRELIEVFKDTISDWSQRSGIESEVNIEGEGKSSPAIEETLLRILQEGLANITRHSAASKVEVTLLYKSNEVTIVIKDNGCGFDPQRVYEGLGLSSMKERAGAMSGGFMVSSQPGQGTVLTATLPNEQKEG